ncbi:unnamed protein product, partial [Didymodactylos carnosus]
MGHFTMKLLNNGNRLYSIKHEHGQLKMFTQMNEYRLRDLFTDVTLKINDQNIRAHKVVLSAGSSYFASMFDSPLIESKLDEIDMTKTIPCPMALNWIIDFIYNSSISLNDKNVLPLLTCSFCLQLDSLSNMCISYLADQLHSSNCVGVLLYAKQYQCEQLETIAQNYVYNHFEDVVRNEEFLNLTASDLYNMIRDDNVKVKCESIIYNAVMQWVRHDPIKRRSELEGLLPCVRLCFLPPSFLEHAKCDEIYGTDDMRKCQEYLSQVYNKLTSHKYCRLPPRRQPIKPLVI